MNSVLEKILGSVEHVRKIVDDIPHRKYSKLTKKWEDKGHSKYSLSALFDGVSWITMLTDRVYMPPLGCMVGYSTVQSHFGIRDGKHEDGTREINGRKIIDKFFYYPEKMMEKIRAPELIVGLGLVGKGIFEGINYFIDGNSSNPNEAISDSLLGLSLVSNASAFYIRDSDPKAIDKNPLWKEETAKLVDYVADKIGPKPEPVPIKI